MAFRIAILHFPVRLFGFCVVLAICRILELKADISQYFQHFGVPTSHFPLLCNVLVLELFVLHDTLQLGFIYGDFFFCVGLGLV